MKWPILSTAGPLHRGMPPEIRLGSRSADMLVLMIEAIAGRDCGRQLGWRPRGCIGKTTGGSLSLLATKNKPTAPGRVSWALFLFRPGALQLEGGSTGGLRRQSSRSSRPQRPWTAEPLQHGWSWTHQCVINAETLGWFRICATAKTSGLGN